MNQAKKAFYADNYEPREFNVSASPKSVVYQIEIDAEIESRTQFSTAIKVMGMCKSEDVCEIHLSSPGGSLDAVDALLHAMQQTEAHIHIVATGNCSSAATFILLEADSFELSNSFNALIHCGSVGSAGNSNEFRKSSEFYNSYMEKTLRSHYEGLLSEEEIVGMLNGQDIWLDAQQWCDRYKQRYEYFKEKAETMEKEAARLEAAIQALEQEPPVTLKPTRKKKVA